MRMAFKLAGVAVGSVLATVAAGGIAMAAMGTSGAWGLGHVGAADLNGDGQVTRAEWLRSADTRFAALDANKDGKLAASELPRPHGGHGHGRHDARWDGAPDAPWQAVPAATQAPALAAPANGTAPQSN